MTETEPNNDTNDDKSEEEKMNEFKHFVQNGTVLTDSDSDDKELESLANHGKEALIADKQFRKFKKRVSREPKQVCINFGKKITSPSPNSMQSVGCGMPHAKCSWHSKH